MSATASLTRPRGRAGRRPGLRPVPLWALSVLVALVLCAPLVFLVLEGADFGWASLSKLVFRSLTATLLWHTVALAGAVTALSAVIGTLGAWCIERTDLPARRLWAVLVVIPVGIPDFAVAFGWRSIFPGLGGFGGALLVMTLAVYPLVYLPVAASLRSADAGQEEVARSLGVGRLSTFARITLAQARPALIGGCVLVALVVLAEYGAFEILGYQTLTTEVFTEFTNGFNTPAACGLSLVLVVLSVLVLGVEGAGRGRGRTQRVGSFVPRAQQPQQLGRATLGVSAALSALVGLALGVPIGAIAYWLFQPAAGLLPGAASLASAAVHSALYGLGAGLAATAAAVPVSLLSVRHPGRLARLLEASTVVVLAVPGLIIALALVFASTRYAGAALYQSTALLLVAYAIMFFPLALVAVRASLSRAPVRLEEIGRSLGRSRLEVLWRVTLPLVGPGLAAAFCLVFLEVITELTATLVLIPTGAQTLATQFWAYQQNLSYSGAAPYAALMVGVAVIPSYILGRWFDRMPTGAR